MENSSLSQAIHYFKTGQKNSATHLLIELLRQEPNNEVALLWLAACVDKQDQKRDCLYRVLAINPNNTNAQKALAEIELQYSKTNDVTTNFGVILKCPSCGSVMGSPDYTGLVQCGYCGTSITYHPPSKAVETKNIDRFVEICKSSLSGRNFNEVIIYCNKILEIDPKNFSAWIYKATATYNLTTEDDERFDEAVECCKQAEKIDSVNPIIGSTFEEINDAKFRFYIMLGDKYGEIVGKTIQVHPSQYNWGSNSYVKQKCQNDLLKAVGYYCMASRVREDDDTPLYYIKDLVKFGNWITWDEEVKNRVLLLKKREEALEISNLLKKLQKELIELETEFESCKNDTGFFAGTRRGSIAKGITTRKGNIAYFEKYLKELNS